MGRGRDKKGMVREGTRKGMGEGEKEKGRDGQTNERGMGGGTREGGGRRRKRMGPSKGLVVISTNLIFNFRLPGTDPRKASISDSSAGLRIGR